MDSLAAACELTKAALYHHYPAKEALALDVLTWTRQQIARSLFAIAYNTELPVTERLDLMNRRYRKLFRDGTIGCLMGITAVDAPYGAPGLMPVVRAYFDEWVEAMTVLFAEVVTREQAGMLARQTVADYEGAILMARVYEDVTFLDGVGERALALLTEKASLPGAKAKPPMRKSRRRT